MDEMKTCKKCGEIKPATSDYFKAAKICKNGITGTCKKCYKERDKQYREAHKEKSINYGKLYRAANKVKASECNKQYRETHKNEASRYGRLYRESHKDKISESKRNWDLINRHTVDYKNRHIINEQRRRIRKRELPATLTPKQWEDIKLDFNLKCAYCGKEKPLTQDHFLALDNGGEYTHNNIIPACRSCNSRKSKKTFFSWYPKFEYYSKKREKKILEYLNYKNGIQQLAFV